MTSLNSLIEKLAAGGHANRPEADQSPSDQKTDPVYVEKLASAIDYIVDSQHTTEQQYQEPLAQQNVADDLTSSIRNSLITKLAQKSRQGSDETALVQNVLSRLMELRSSAEPEVVETAPVEKTAEPDDYIPQAEEAQSGDIEDLSLADILSSALGADETDESVPSEESVKTAEDRGESPLARKEVTGLLKNRLLTRLGQEAGHGTA